MRAEGALRRSRGRPDWARGALSRPSGRRAGPPRARRRSPQSLAPGTGSPREPNRAKLVVGGKGALLCPSGRRPMHLSRQQEPLRVLPLPRNGAPARCCGRCCALPLRAARQLHSTQAPAPHDMHHSVPAARHPPPCFLCRPFPQAALRQLSSNRPDLSGANLLQRQLLPQVRQALLQPVQTRASNHDQAANPVELLLCFHVPRPRRARCSWAGRAARARLRA
jgi:hypothetical protein